MSDQSPSQRIIAAQQAQLQQQLKLRQETIAKNQERAELVRAWDAVAYRLTPDGSVASRDTGAEAPPACAVSAIAHALRGAAAAPAPLPDVQGPLLRAQGDAVVRQPPAGGPSGFGLGARRRGRRGAEDQPPRRRDPQHRGPLPRAGRRTRAAAPRRTRGFFPRPGARSSSTR